MQPCRLISWAGSVRLGVNGINIKTEHDTVEFYTDKEKIYNNSVLLHNNKLYMTFRRDHDIWITELDDSFTPLNPHILLECAEDARLFILNDQMYCSYTSTEDNAPHAGFGWNQHMHVCRIDSGIVTLDRHLFQRKPWEKNWQFFQLKDGIHCIYEYDPFTIFRFNSDFELLEEIHKERVESPGGEIRGSTPPFFHNGLFRMLVHSQMEGKKKYWNWILTFDVNFNVRSISPLDIENGDVIFPCGFIPYKDKFMVSYGYANKVAKIKIMTP